MKLSDTIYLVAGSGYGISPAGDCNCYVVNGGSELALIDTGGGLGVEAILDNIRGDGLDPKKLDKILITHCHFDHIGGNDAVQEETGARIFSHPSEKEAIETLNDRSLYSMALERGLEFDATSVDTTVTEGDIIQVGDIGVKVVETPGHTPGCISFLLDEDGSPSILCGDIAGASGRLGYINGPGFVLDDWKASIKKLLAIEPRRLYPGHGTFLLGDASPHLMQYDDKMNAAWTTIITSVG